MMHIHNVIRTPTPSSAATTIIIPVMSLVLEELPVSVLSKIVIKVLYDIAGKFGEEFNLAVWRIGRSTTKLKSAKIKS